MREMPDSTPSKENAGQQRIRGRKMSRPSFGDILENEYYFLPVMESGLRELDAVNPSLLTEESRRKYESDRAEIEEDFAEAVSSLIGDMRETEGFESLSGRVRPEDAEVLGYDGDSVPEGLSDRLAGAEARLSDFRNAEYFADLPLDGRTKDAIYETLLLESATPSLREEFLNRKRDRSERLLRRKESGKIPDVGYEYFDPEEELGKVSSFTVGQCEELTREEYGEEKSRRLAVFKERLSEQRRGIERLNLELEDLLLGDGRPFDEVKRGLLWERILERSEQLKLSPVQRGRYLDFLDRLERRSRETDALIGDSELGRDDVKLFTRLFREVPFGKVSIRRGPISLIVECDNECFAHMHGLTPENAAQRAGICMGDTVTINTDSLQSEPERQGAIDHEVRHSLNQILDALQHDSMEYDGSKIGYLNQPDRYDLEGLAGHEREAVEQRQKDEIIAYLKGGVEDPGMIRLALSGAEYDYVGMLKGIHGRGRNPLNRMRMNAAFERERKEIDKLLSNTLDIVETLHFLGIPNREIISMFEFEPIGRWKKTVARREENGDFSDLRKRTADSLAKDIARLRSTVHGQYFPRRFVSLSRLGIMALIIPKSVREAIGRRSAEQHSEEYTEKERELNEKLRQLEMVSAPFHR